MLKKSGRSSLGPVFAAFVEFDEAKVPAVLRRFQGEIRVGGSCVVWVAFGREKGIIESVDEERRNRDTIKHGAATALRPVVAGVLEAMDGSREAIIKIRKRPHFFESGQIQIIWVAPGLFANFGAQAAHEAGHVDAVLPVFEPFGAASQVTRYADSDSTADARVQARTRITEVFQSEISAQAEAHQADGLVLGIRKDMVQYDLKLFGRTAVVTLQFTIGLATAAPKVPNQDVPVGAPERRRHPLAVVST